MADAVVSGRIENQNQAEFRASAGCAGSPPYGRINGQMETVIRGRRFNYSFHSDKATRLIATRFDGTPFVYMVFKNATVVNETNHSSTVRGTIILSTMGNNRDDNMASLTIERPGRVMLRAIGSLDGRIRIIRRNSCGRG